MNLKRMTKKQLIAMLIMESAPATTSSTATAEQLRKIVKNWDQENFVIMVLDSQNRAIKSEVLFQGGVNFSAVDIKLIFTRFFSVPCGVSLIIGHNHPSGIMKTSLQDDRLTIRINDACKMLDIKLLDHVIFSPLYHYSYADNTHMLA